MVNDLVTDEKPLPREPTQAMLDAARDWSAREYGKPIGHDAAARCWRVMWDAGTSKDETMTYQQFEAAVIAGIIRQTGWTEQQAKNTAGDLQEFIDEKMSPADAVSEIFYAAAT